MTCFDSFSLSVVGMPRGTDSSLGSREQRNDFSGDKGGLSPMLDYSVDLLQMIYKLARKNTTS